MKSIYSSKLYIASSRKDKIKSAINNPLNSELVVQLRDYLDEEYLNEDYLGEVSGLDTDDTSTGFDELVDDNGEDTSEDTSHSSHSSHSSGGGNFSLSKEMGDIDDALDSDSQDLDTDTSSESDAKESKSSDEGDVSESIKINKSKITASVSQFNLDVLLGTLNSREDTAGVVRCKIKDNELWIYYSDKINLNNIMENVIQFISTYDNVNLEFNRLARTDNAVVFQSDVIEAVQANEGDEDE